MVPEKSYILWPITKKNQHGQHKHQHHLLQQSYVSNEIALMKVTLPKGQDKNLNILRTKRAFEN